jgi:hypothetical protein
MHAIGRYSPARLYSALGQLEKLIENGFNKRDPQAVARNLLIVCLELLQLCHDETCFRLALQQLLEHIPVSPLHRPLQQRLLQDLNAAKSGLLDYGCSVVAALVSEQLPSDDDPDAPGKDAPALDKAIYALLSRPEWTLYSLLRRKTEVSEAKAIREIYRAHGRVGVDQLALRNRLWNLQHRLNAKLRLLELPEVSRPRRKILSLSRPENS